MSGGTTVSWWDSISATYKVVSNLDPLPVNATVNAQAEAVATAANPAYAEGTAQPLSQTLFGGLRVTLLQPDGTPYTAGGSGGAAVTATALAPTYVEGSSANPFSSNLKGAIRFMPALPGGTDFDLSQPALLAGVDGLTAASLANPIPVGVAQGSVSAGQFGPIVQAAVTTAAPAYVNGQTSPFSLDLTGALRVTGGGVAQGSATAGQSGNLIQAAVTTASPAYTTGQTSPLSLTLAGALRTEPTSIVGAKVATAGPAAANAALVGTIYNALGWTSATVDGQQQALRSENTGQLQVSLYVGGASLVAYAPQNIALPGSNGLFTNAAPALESAAGSTFQNGRTVARASNTQGTGVQAIGLPLWSTSDLTGLRINVAASGDTALVAGVGGQTTRVYRMRLSVAGAVVVQIKDGATVLEVFNFPAAGGSVILDLSDRPYYRTAVAAALNINLSAAVQVDGRLEFVQSA